MSPNLEQLIMGFGTGLVVLAVGLLVTRIPKPVAWLSAVGVGMIVFILWPRATLVEVPDVSDLTAMKRA